MNILAWILQIILGLLFLSAGFMKTFKTQQFQEKMDWAKKSSTSYIKFIGIAEILGGIGLILPWAIDMLPILTPIAAVGLAIIMFLAGILHAKLKENSAIVNNAVFLILLVVIAITRF